MKSTITRNTESAVLSNISLHKYHKKHSKRCNSGHRIEMVENETHVGVCFGGKHGSNREIRIDIGGHMVAMSAESAQSIAERLMEFVARSQDLNSK